METLVSAAKLQPIWSRSATRLTRALDRSRKATVVPGASGALLAAIARQIPETQISEAQILAHDWVHGDLAVASGAMLWRTRMQPGSPGGARSER